MSQRQGPLNEEAIWDDSALVDSWNDALKEYKKYHSIHTKGGSVRGVEEENSTATPNATFPAGGQKGWASSEPTTSGIEREDLAMEEGEAMSDGHEQVHLASSTGAGDLPPDADNTTGQCSAGFKFPAAFPLQTTLGSAQDENLKRLLMAWYYAGYYTGLTERNQQAQQPSQ